MRVVFVEWRPACDTTILSLNVGVALNFAITNHLPLIKGTCLSAQIYMRVQRQETCLSFCVQILARKQYLMEGVDSNTSCSSNASLTSRHLIIIHGSLFGTSAVVCLFALSWLAGLKLHKQLLYRLASYPVIGSLLLSVFEVFQFHFLSYDDSKYTLCVIIGYLDQVAALINLCFGGWVTFHLFYFVLFYKNLKKLEPLYIITSVLLPIVISAIPLVTKSYGPNGQWCWIQSRRLGCEYLTGFVEKYVTFYGPLFLLLVLESIAMVIMLVTVYYRSCQKGDHSGFGCDQNKTVFKHLLPLVAYPIIFCVFSMPPLINQVYELTSPNYGFRIFSSTCIPISSLAAGLTYIVHIAIVRSYAHRRSYRAHYDVIHGSEEVTTFNQETQTNANSHTTAYVGPESTQWTQQAQCWRVYVSCDLGAWRGKIVNCSSMQIQT